MKNIDFTPIYKKYANKWVAIDDKTGKVAGAGTTLKLAYQRAQMRGIKDPVVTKIPKNPGFYVLHTI